MHVEVRDGEVVDVQLRIYEPPRFFEALLRGRRLHRAARHHRPDLRHLPGRLPDERVQRDRGRLRRRRRRAARAAAPARSTAASGSRATRCTSTCCTPPTSSASPARSTMAEHDRGIVERGLQLKKAGNRIIELVGGRPIHPINVRVGGFYRTPDAGASCTRCASRCSRARDAALETVRWVAGFEFPDFEQDYEFVALRARRRVPDRPRPDRVDAAASTSPVAEFDDEVEEEQSAALDRTPRSTPRRRRVLRRPDGPLQPQRRPALAPRRGRRRPPPGSDRTCRNPFRSIVVRGVEVLYACDEALRIIDGLRGAGPARACRSSPWPATGYGAHARRRAACSTTATGSTADGTILDVHDRAPDLAEPGHHRARPARTSSRGHLDLADDALRLRCEQAIRNYDPCISCATHFLDLTVERT